MTCEGFLTFDRQAARIDHLDLNRVRKPAAGTGRGRAGYQEHAHRDPPGGRGCRRLSPMPPGGRSPWKSPPTVSCCGWKCRAARRPCLHDRHWHMFWEDPKLIVLKRLDGGQVIAQCNLRSGPHAGKGRHQDPTQFRDDIRRGLKKRFVQFLGAGEVDGNPAGGFRYKVGVQGREGQLGIVWYYLSRRQPRGRTAPGHVHPGRRSRQDVRRPRPRDDRLAPLVEGISNRPGPMNRPGRAGSPPRSQRNP